MSRLTIHESITADRIMEAVERHQTTLDNPGFCIRCGEDAEGVEPDARWLHVRILRRGRRL